MSESAEERLAGFMAAYPTEIAATARLALDKLRALIPGAMELVYDNYNALVIGFGATERSSEAVLSIALYPRWVTLFFLHGAGLPDPHRLLKGSGSQVRSIVLQSSDDLDRPAVRELITAAVARSATPFDAASSGRMVIKSVSARQRPRRP